MKKIIAISLLFVFVCNYTELHQLLKLPMLFHHFTDHKHTDNDISFVDFIGKHYGDKNSNAHNHNNEHEKLPFKSNDCHVVHSSIASFVSFTFTFQFQTPTTSSINICYLENLLPSVIIPIWQPPKLA